ncbi:exported hypothetical protein [Magnetospirillum sp. LM-5]|uniref:hypothetical protein n=1 Tax=Magnetospirillum sp. LM-5 TaxID=2681466 RepID=UPI0013804FA4|nr:hypothetical protein [Magnetospirillum sp. LM-5]CAA7618551.1 exported hypothetical protein [Magnetospirillum sp. LM-5]
MRAVLLILALSLVLSGPALSAPKDDPAARLGVVEALIPRLEKQLDQQREQAAKAAKDEAEGVEKVLTAQVQGVRDLLLLLATLLPLAGGLGGLFTYSKAKREARQQAKEEMETIRAQATAALDQARQELEAAMAELARITQARCEAEEHNAAAEKARHDAEDHSERVRALAQGTAQLTPDEANRADQALASPSPASMTTHSTVELISLAVRALDTHRHAEAEQALITLTRRRPDDSLGWMLRARLRLEQHRPAEALDAAARAHSVAKDDQSKADASGWRGDALAAVGDRAGAAEAWDQSRAGMEALAQAYPDVSGYRRDLAIAWIRVGEGLQDRGAAENAYLQAETILHQQISGDPDQAQTVRSLAGVLRRRAGLSKTQADGQGLLDQAGELLGRARTLDPDDCLIRRDVAWLRAAWGDGHLRGGDQAQARTCWAEAVATWEAMDKAGTLDWYGRRPLAEYRAKLGRDDPPPSA